MSAVNFHERVAIVTGASTGLGEAMVRKLAAEGLKVVLAARNKENLDRIVADITKGAARRSPSRPMCARKPTSSNLFKTDDEQFGRLDVLVNMPASLSDPDVGSHAVRLAGHHRANLTSAFLCSREAMKIFKQQKRGPHHQHRFVRLRLSCRVAISIGYAATKSALDGLTHSCALDGREHGITASIIQLGVADSNLGAGQRVPRPPEQMMQASEIADTLFAMIKPAGPDQFHEGDDPAHRQAFPRPRLSTFATCFRRSHLHSTMERTAAITSENIKKSLGERAS